MLNVASQRCGSGHENHGSGRKETMNIRSVEEFEGGGEITRK